MSGHIPENFIHDLIARTDLVDLIGKRLKLKKSGIKYWGCCPFHQEKTPSFCVNSSDQFYHCFGCGAHGKALNFIMESDNLNFPDAVETLARRLGIDVPREHSLQQANKQIQYTALYATLEKAATFFQQKLAHTQQNSIINNYIIKRGITAESIEKFRLGFAPPGWNNINIDVEQNSTTLLEAGLLIQNNEKNRTYDFFRERLMFPIRDSRGRPIAFGGRIISDKNPKYLNSPESLFFKKSKALYGLYEIKKYNRDLKNIIVVEGYMDVVMLHQQGITNAVATLGTATTVEHITLLFKATNNIIFCFDGDQAGRAAAVKALDSVLSAIKDGCQVYFIFLPQGQDPDSIVRKEGSRQFNLRIQNESLSLDDFLFNMLKTERDMNTMAGKTGLIADAKKYIDLLTDTLFKEAFLDRLAYESQIDKDSIKQRFRIATTTTQTSTTIIHPAKVTEQPSLKTPSKKKSLRPVKADAEFASGKISAAAYAIRQLLSNTQLASDVEDLSAIAESATLDTDTKLLISLIGTLKQFPNLSPVTLIINEPDNHNRRRLEVLSTADLGVNKSATEFHDAIKYLLQQQQDTKKEQAIKSLKATFKTHKNTPASLSTEERVRFKNYQKHLLDKINKKNK